MAVQAQASSSKNSAPVQSEDLQPNEAVRKCKGAGMPPSIASTTSTPKFWLGSGRKGREATDKIPSTRPNWPGGAAQRRAPFSELWEIQEIRRRHFEKGSTVRRTGPDVSSGNHSGHGSGRMAAERQHQASPSSQTTSLTTLDPSPSPRRGHPLPLPPPSTARASKEESQPTKPYTTPLPTLKQKAPFPRLSTTLHPSSSKTGQHIARSPPPKRRKMDTITSEPRTSATPGRTDGGITSQDSHQDLIPSPPWPKEVNRSGAPGLPQVPPTSPPVLSPIATSPVNVKCEPESPSPLAEERKAVTSYVTRFALPDNCKKEHQGWMANRRLFRIEKVRELEKKGLVLVGPHILREDGLSIEWTSRVPVWNDTLERVSLADTQKMDNAIPGHPSLPKVSVPNDIAQCLERRSPQVGTLLREPSPVGYVTQPSEPNSTNNVNWPSPKFAPSRSPSKSSQPPHAEKPRVSVLSSDVPSIATVSPPPKRKRKSHVARGDLDLATAIELSQRTNASPARPRSRDAYASPSGSPSCLTTIPFSSASIRSSSRQPAVPSRPPSAAAPQLQQQRQAKEHGRRSGGKQRLATQSVQLRERDTNDELEIGEESPGVGPPRKETIEAERAGWTVIERVDPSDGADEDEDDTDELVGDDENDVREEIITAEVVSIHDANEEPMVPKDAAGESVPPASVSANEALRPLTIQAAEDTANDDSVVRDFISSYMQLFETDRDNLISIYAPDAIFRYRVHEESQPSSRSRGGQTSFPLITARGHAEISSSLLALQHLHFCQKLDDNGNKKVDLEYYKEQSREDISLYVRSMMASGDADGMVGGQQQRRIVDHDFWLWKSRIEEAEASGGSSKGGWPVLVRNHLMIMHEEAL